MNASGWQIVKTDLYERRFKDFQKSKRDQLKAILRNFERFWQMLEDQPQARLITANFIHDERHGVISIDQQGYKPKQPPTRLYLYPRQKSCKLYAITIGDKRTQSQDVKTATSSSKHCKPTSDGPRNPKSIE
jgi:hypothetical protein